VIIGAASNMGAEQCGREIRIINYHNTNIGIQYLQTNNWYNITVDNKIHNQNAQLLRTKLITKHLLNKNEDNTDPYTSFTRKKTKKKSQQCNILLGFFKNLSAIGVG